MKIYSKHKFIDGQRKKNLQNEIRILRRLNHPNIVRLFEVIENVQQVYLAMECLKGGLSMYSYLREKTGKRVDEEECKSLFYQVVEAPRRCSDPRSTR